MKQTYHAEHGRKSRGIAGYASLILFFVLLFGFAVLNLFWPKRTLSELENRKLAQMPSFSWTALLNGDWFEDFSTYVQDQVAFRDGWIDLQSDFNALCLQKVEQNGILLGKDHWMFTRNFGTPSIKQLDKNVSAVAEFGSRYPGRVTFLLAPSASVIYEEELPLAAPMVDENTMLDEIFAAVSPTADVIDLRSVYTDAKDEYLYYRTDHHWTTYGAYLAYQQFCTLKGLTPFDTSAHSSVEVPDFYGTHYSSTRYWNVAPDTITYYPLDNPMTVYQVNGEADFSTAETATTVDTEKFETRDKYAAFLGGNNGYSVIEGDGEGSILVIKDSYANCFIPYLTANYAKIGVIDFRNYAFGPDSIIEQEGYDQILVLYNFQTFLTDTKVIYLNRPTTLTAES